MFVVCTPPTNEIPLLTLTSPLPNPNLRDVKTKDGCTINFDSLPGGPYPDFDQGHTLTHEIGHWLNLQHTFRGGCEGGDMVRDTPAEEVPIYGCPTYFPDTCTGPKYPGLDPIHNYMGYVSLLRYLELWERGSRLTGVY